MFTVSAYLNLNWRRKGDGKKEMHDVQYLSSNTQYFLDFTLTSEMINSPYIYIALLDTYLLTQLIFPTST